MEASADGPMHMLDRRVVTYWLVSGLFSSLIMGALLIVVAYNIGDEPATTWIQILRVAVLVLTGVMLVWALVSPALAYARWRYRVDPELLRMRYGIFFHEERTIPINRLQHVDLSRGPIERLFGLATLVVFTAGNEGSAFRVPGLRVSVAEPLRDQILAARGDDVL